jgi:putative transposase
MALGCVRGHRDVGDWLVSGWHAARTTARAPVTRPEAEHQRCTVHYLRNVRSQISSKALQQEVQAALKDCWAAPDRAEAEARLHRLLDRLRSTLPRLAEWLEETFGDTLAFFSLPAGEHRRRLKTTNSVEHDHAEVRRRSRVVRIFPNEPALIRLLGALAMECLPTRLSPSAWNTSSRTATMSRAPSMTRSRSPVT